MGGSLNMQYFRHVIDPFPVLKPQRVATLDGVIVATFGGVRGGNGDGLGASNSKSINLI